MKRISAISVCIFLVFQAIPAAAAVKAGAACKSAGITSEAAGKTYTCIKSGKKLIWSKGVTQPLSSQNKATLTPTSILSDVKNFSNLDPCKIIDGDPALTNMSAGFPIPKGRIDLRSGANIHLIGVDFVDKKGGTKSPQETFGDTLKSMQNFWTNQSSVPVKFNLNWYPKWQTLPNPIKSYQMGGSFFDGKFNSDTFINFAKNIVSITDKDIDFKGINLLIIMFPPGIMSDEIGTFMVDTQHVLNTEEGAFENLIVAGGDYADLDTYIHEFGHAVGLTDIRDTTDLKYQKSDGMYYDIMNNPTIPELLVWHRFLLGFLENSQIHCITNSDPSTHWLVPVEKSSNEVKGVVIPLSSTEALIVESRRAVGFDTVLARRPDLAGVVVYTLDSKIPYHRTPVRVVSVLKGQEEVITNGFNIKVIETGDFGDVVKIEKSA